MKKKNLTTYEDHLDKQYGKRGSKKREEYESGFESFKLGVMIRQAREELNLTQSALVA